MQHTTPLPPFATGGAHAHPAGSAPGYRDPPAGRLYWVEGLTSAGTTLLIVGIFFYTAHRFQWGLGANFRLAAAQGAAYVVGALLAGPLAARWAGRWVLAVVYGTMGVLSAATLAAGSAALVTVALLAYSLLAGITWPILESLASTGVRTSSLSRRIAVYNLVWSGVGAVTIAVNGAIIERWPAGIFLLPAIAHALSVLLLCTGSVSAGGAPPERQTPLDPEPELLRVRTLALWLSRLALPATYVVIYSLMALMPSLPVMKSLTTTAQTAVGSTWMVSRWLTFVLLGFSVWWHTRPRAMLVAAAFMLVAFVGMTVRPSQLLWGGAAEAQWIDLTAMIAWQIVLGVSLGLIYSASLYFGMVLSEGSTEHGGYHEALIGLGSVLGPGAGALAQHFSPGHVNTGIAAVSAVIALSVLAVATASVFAARGKAR